MNPLEAYVDRLQEVHATRRGTPELSYRAALENLLNDVGAKLDPVVQATAELADSGAGHPDFGLFESKSGNLRSVVEVKSFGDRRVTRLVGRFLKSGVLSEAQFLRTEAGTPQGGIITPPTMLQTSRFLWIG